MHNIVCYVYQVIGKLFFLQPPHPPKHTHNPIKYLLVTIYKWNTWA